MIKRIFGMLQKEPVADNKAPRQAGGDLEKISTIPLSGDAEPSRLLRKLMEEGGVEVDDLNLARSIAMEAALHSGRVVECNARQEGDSIVYAVKFCGDFTAPRIQLG